MLLWNLRKNDLPVGTIQFILSIVIGEKAGRNLEEAILGVSTSSLKKYVIQEKEKSEDGCINTVQAVIKCMRTEKVFERGNCKYTLDEYNRRFTRSSCKAIDSNELYVEVMRISRDYDRRRCISLFADTPYAKEALMAQIAQTYYSVSNKARPTPAKLNAIFNDFKTEQLMKYSSDYTFSSDKRDNPVGWLVSALMYFNKNDTYYTDRVDERNQDQLIGGDKGTTQMELVGMEGTKEEVKIDFVSVVSRINKASALLYGHKKSRVAFSDIFTHYLNSKIEEIRERVVKKLGINVSLYTVRNSWNPKISDKTHVSNKKNSRDKIAAAMIPLAENGVGVMDVAKLYRRVLETNDSILLNKEGTIKDGMRLFDAQNISVKDKMSNGERFERLFHGYIALGEFLRYLDSRDISPFSIPPDIFRDIYLPRRFYSLDEYLCLKDKTKELMQEAELDSEKSRPVVNGIRSNDTLFDTLLLRFSNESVASVQDFLRSSCTLGNIKEAIDSVERKKRRDVCDQRAGELYRKYEKVMSCFTLGVVRTKDMSEMNVSVLEDPVKVPAFERYVSRLGESTGKKYFINYARCFPGKADYVRFVDPLRVENLDAPAIKAGSNGGKIETSRERFAKMYGTLFNPWEQYFILHGSYSCHSLNELKWYHLFLFQYMFHMYKLIKGGKPCDSFLRGKVCRTYISVLEALMAAEGHPVKKSHFYALTENTLESEFAYLLDGHSDEASVRQINSEIARRKFCIEFCCSSLLENVPKDGWNRLRDCLIAADTYEKYWSKVLDALATIGNVKKEFITMEEFKNRTACERAYTKFKNDGSFAALVRATSFVDLLSVNNPISSINDIPFLWDLDLYNVMPNGDIDTKEAEQHGKNVAISTINRIIAEAPELMEFFKDTQEGIDSKIRKGLENVAIAADSPDRERLLKDAASSIRNTQSIIDEITEGQRSYISTVLGMAPCDNLGYLKLFNRRYCIKFGDLPSYVHRSGYWVQLDGSKYSLKPISTYDYEKGIRDILR